MSYQQRLFDGYTVSHEKGTVSTFQIEDEDIQHFQADGTIVLVLTATIAGGSFKHDTSGDWVRTNKLTTHEVRVATGVMKEEIVEFYNLLGDQLPFARPASGTATTGAASSGTSSLPGGSTHVDPSVAPTGNTGELDPDDDDTPADQDFSYEVDDTVDQAVAANGDTPRDKALAAFLNEPAP